MLVASTRREDLEADPEASYEREMGRREGTGSPGQASVASRPGRRPASLTLVRAIAANSS